MLDLPDDLFHLIMHYRNRLMRRDEVRELRKEIQFNKIEIKSLEDEISELWDREEEDAHSTAINLEEFSEDLKVEIDTMRIRIKDLKELRLAPMSICAPLRDRDERQELHASLRRRPLRYVGEAD